MTASVKGYLLEKGLLLKVKSEGWPIGVAGATCHTAAEVCCKIQMHGSFAALRITRAGFLMTDG